MVPDPEKSLEQGAILPWRRGGKRMVVYYKGLLRGVAKHYEQSMEVPYKTLPEDFQRVLLWGSGETEIEFTFWRAGKMSKVTRPFEGVIPNLQRLYQESESEFTRNRLKGFMSPQFCDACQGRRLKPEILAVRWWDGSRGRVACCVLRARCGTRTTHHAARSAKPSTLNASTPQPPRLPGLSIMDVCALSVERADEFFATLKLTEFQEKIAHDLIKEIRARLGFLKNVGLGYLTLDRESGTLSGGEAQRIRLATQIGAGLVGVLYILDEPSIGLHQRDNDRLLNTLEGLRDLGNSVLVVEHDADTIRHADYILDLGPGAGVRGGELVAAGTLAEVLAHPQSLTAKYLRGELSIPVPRQRSSRPRTAAGWKCWARGRTTSRTLMPAFRWARSRASPASAAPARARWWTTFCGARCSGSSSAPRSARALIAPCTGFENLDKVIVIDQTPIGRTPRSNPATYTGMFNHIRDLFARLPAAKIRGYGSGRFSFNVKGGPLREVPGRRSDQD